METAEGSATGERPRLLDRVVLTVVVSAIYLPALASVGLRTDVGAHLRFAEYLSVTGRTPLPYYLYEQLVIGVRAVVPFQALERLDPDLGDRAAIWDISGVVVLLVATVLLAQLVYAKLLASSGGTTGRGVRAVCGVLATSAMVVAPITVLTWSDQNLLNGYVSITSYENPTVILARLLAVVLFWVVVEGFFDRNPTRTVVLAAVLSASVLHAKPSFTVCFLPAMCLLAVWSRWRGRTFDARLFWWGLVAPSTAVLLFQLFMAQGEGSFALAPFKVINDLFESRGRSPWWFVVLVVLSVLFPLLVTALHWSRARASLTLVMAWLTFGVGLAIFCLFTVTGRVDYGDFIWGPQIAALILFVESMRLVLVDLVGPRRRLDVRAVVIAVALVAHVVCGAVLWYHEVVDPAAWW
jgi:hypothetical protein